MKNVGYFSKTDRSGRNIHFGVREHAMGTVLNGIALHGGFIPFGGTFPCFCRLYASGDPYGSFDGVTFHFCL